MEFELAKRLEIIPPLQNPVEQSDGERVAIVVLGGGRYSAAPEFGQDVVGQSTLERLRYAARLHRQTDFPLLVTGGVPLNEAVSEAQLMAESLRNDFLVEKVSESGLPKDSELPAMDLSFWDKWKDVYQ